MTKQSVGSGTASGSSTAVAKGDHRHSFVAQFLQGAAVFARRAHVLEGHGSSPQEDELAEHSALVVGALIGSAAALEADVSEVLAYGPGRHLGPNANDNPARALLSSLAPALEKLGTIEKYEVVLKLLQCPPLDRGQSIHQAAVILVRSRNEVIHYKSLLSEDRHQKKIMKSLEALKLRAPPFAAPSAPFFPQRCLSASLASWAVITSCEFITEIYEHLGVTSPITAHTSRLVVPTPRK